MDLGRLGRQFPTRLSFMRVLTRRMCREAWTIEREHVELDARGAGCVVYRVDAAANTYRMVLFAHDLDPARRSDRVIADAWDVTATLCTGEVDARRRRELAAQVPLQEAGRLDSSCIVLTRANRSSRQFERIVNGLARGRQPETRHLLEVGYLYRTTAVYGSGKFGMSDWSNIHEHHPDLARPFAAEMLACYLLRQFGFDQVEHLARLKSPATAVALSQEAKRSLGIGNATGLGMAPFLVNHPLLIGRWILQRETALARVLASASFSRDKVDRMRVVLTRAALHLEQIRIGNEEQLNCNRQVSAEARRLCDWLEHGSPVRDWAGLLEHVQAECSVESQELLISVILEVHPELVDDLEEGMVVEETYELDPGMRARELRELIESHCGWVLEIDFEQPASTAHFWYRSEEKMEPRLGLRGSEAGADREMRIGLAREIARCHQALIFMLQDHGDSSTAEFVLKYPELRYIVRRLQTLTKVPYGEIRANLLDASVLPIHLLRCKLAFMGVTKFDPRSRLWVRNTMFQGAPLPEELNPQGQDDWSFPVMSGKPG